MSLIDDAGPYRCVDLLGQTERHPGIIEALGPRILIEGPEHLPRFTDDPADPVEENRLGIGKVMQNEADWPLARSVSPGELFFGHLKVRQRSISGCFEARDDVHALNYN